MSATDPYAKPEPRYTERLEPSVPVPMRDGTRLATDLHFPVGAPEPLPVILIRTPYNKNTWRDERSDARVFAGQGFVVAVQDVRGKFESEGRYTVSKGDGEDGYDTIDWLVAQPWCNGNIGTYGCSYLGENQLMLAKLRHPNHRCAVPKAASGGKYRFSYRNGGVVSLMDAMLWFRNNGAKVAPHYDLGDDPALLQQAMPYFQLRPNLPQIDPFDICRALPVVDIVRSSGAPPTDYEDFVSRDPWDPWWDEIGYITDDDEFDVPALFTDSWYDYGPGDGLEIFNQFRNRSLSWRARENIYAIIAPGLHCAHERAREQTVVGQRDLGDARYPFWQLYLDWFDHWLRGVDNGVESQPKLRIYVMGRNIWREEQEWPPARAVFTPWYLHSAGHANSRYGDGSLSPQPPADEPPDHYTYDPATPAPSRGGPSGSGASDVGAIDQRDVEMRHDILVYTSDPLPDGLEVTGPLEVVLYVSSSAPDTDFIAKLIDVYPDGRAFNVQEGAARARYREGSDHEVWMQPGGVYEVRIWLQATSNWFAPGHRIRLDISSSCFPRWERNLNTGGRNYDETEWQVAHTTIHHAPGRASYVLLPVMSD
ncbi:MAG: hypothetical protein DCC58_20265 [Chloroflexi bacterium]|nr:MAG: hypothetical protein DCC58_20265 [Chloroflexota bacterium]